MMRLKIFLTNYDTSEVKAQEEKHTNQAAKINQAAKKNAESRELPEAVPGFFSPCFAVSSF